MAMGPQGPQGGTGSLPGGSPGHGEHGEEVRSHFWKTRFLAPRPSPVQPVKTASKQAPQPPGPISIAPGCFSGPGGYQKCLRSLPGDPFWVPGAARGVARAARGSARAARGGARAARGVPELPFLKKNFFFRCRYSLRVFFRQKTRFLEKNMLFLLKKNPVSEQSTPTTTSGGFCNSFCTRREFRKSNNWMSYG